MIQYVLTSFQAGSIYIYIYTYVYTHSCMYALVYPLKAINYTAALWKFVVFITRHLQLLFNRFSFFFFFPQRIAPTAS